MLFSQEFITDRMMELKRKHARLAHELGTLNLRIDKVRMEEQCFARKQQILLWRGRANDGKALMGKNSSKRTRVASLHRRGVIECVQWGDAGPCSALYKKEESNFQLFPDLVKPSDSIDPFSKVGDPKFVAD